jgi:hypothetical protein
MAKTITSVTPDADTSNTAAQWAGKPRTAMAATRQTTAAVITSATAGKEV